MKVAPAIASLGLMVGVSTSALAQTDPRPERAQEQSPVTVPDSPPDTADEDAKPGADQIAREGDLAGGVIGDAAKNAAEQQQQSDDKGVAIGKGVGQRQDFPGTNTAPGQQEPVEPPPIEGITN